MGQRAEHCKPVKTVRMQGQHVDEESGLHYNRHWYYDPALGRYISQDPIGVRGGWNLYAYPLNPLQKIDPTGLDAIENAGILAVIGIPFGVPGLFLANSIADDSYQFGNEMNMNIGGIHNGGADALRHCYWMCRMTKDFGSIIANQIGRNHESAGSRTTPPKPKEEESMDLGNNAVGIACGQGSSKKCSESCIGKYNNSELYSYGGGKLSPTSKTSNKIDSKVASY